MVDAARRRVLVTIAAALGMPARRVSAEVVDHVRRTIALPAAATLRIEASMASVRLVGTSRDDISLEVERSAPSGDDLLRFPVVVESDEAGVRIAVVQRGTDARLKAAIRIEVPRRAHIASLRVAEGRLDVADLAGVLGARRAARADRRGRGSAACCGSRPASATSTSATRASRPTGCIRLRDVQRRRAPGVRRRRRPTRA